MYKNTVWSQKHEPSETLQCVSITQHWVLWRIHPANRDERESVSTFLLRWIIHLTSCTRSSTDAWETPQTHISLFIKSTITWICVTNYIHSFTLHESIFYQLCAVWYYYIDTYILYKDVNNTGAKALAVYFFHMISQNRKCFWTSLVHISQNVL